MNEDKARYFGAHYGQKVLILSEGEHFPYPCISKLIETDIEKSYLLLTPLSLISDEDLLTVSRLEEWNYESEPTPENLNIIRNSIINAIEYKRGAINIHTYQHLIKVGTALPFEDKSVSDLISLGWLKINNG